jgi:glycosyltransferase involved in cell wall biosynthesis
MGVGGTERQLAALIDGLDRTLFKPYLITIREREMNFRLACEKHVFSTPKLASVNCLTKTLQMASLFRQEKIRIVHTFFFDANLMGILAGRLARVPVIVSSRRDMGFWHRPLSLRVIRFLNKLTDGFLANSECVREDVAKRELVPLDRIQVVHNGLEPAHFASETKPEDAKRSLGLLPDQKVVGIVANPNREVKRLDVFVDAIPLVLREFHQVHFVIVGDGHLRKDLEDRCRSLRIADVVRFVGARKDIPALLRAFDVGVNTSDSEGLSNAIIEYMMAGIPVVVSDAPGNQEVIEDGAQGYLFHKGVPAALATKLLSILNSPELAKEMGRRGRIRAQERFSTAHMIKKHMDYYDMLLRAYSRSLHKRN